MTLGEKTSDFSTYLEKAMPSFNRYFVKLLVCDFACMFAVLTSIGRFYLWCPGVLEIMLQFPMDWREVVVPRRFICGFAVGGLGGMKTAISSTCKNNYWQIERYWITYVVLILTLLFILTAMQLVSWIFMVCTCQKK